MHYKDHYEGYEGENEFIIEMEDYPDYTIHMWEGHFCTFMDRIQPENGKWTHLALPYNEITGWNYKARWEIPDLQGAYDQLLTIWEYRSESWWGDAYVDLLDLLATAMIKGKKVYVTLE